MANPKCELCDTEMEYLEGIGYVCTTQHCPTLDGEPVPVPPAQGDD